MFIEIDIKLSPLQIEMDTSYRSGLNMSSNNINNNTNRRTSNDTQRSFSLSFGNKFELPLRYIDIKQGHDSGSTLGSSSRWPKPQRQRSGRRSTRGSIESLASSTGASLSTTAQSSSAVPQHKQDWTAAERAEHVATDPKLQSLFQAELSKVGVVTTVAYKAVHQQFIYSEPVNQDIEYITSLAEAHRRDSEDTNNSNGRRGRPMLKRRSSRFGGLSVMKSMAMSVVQSNDVTSEILNDMESARSLKMDKYKDRRGSNTSSRSLKLDKRGSMGSCRSIDIEGCGGLDESTTNLAPRRCSRSGSNLTEEEKQLLLKGSKNQNFDAFLHPIQDTLVQSTSSSESDNKSSSVREEFELRRSLEKSLLLQDIFDGDKGAAFYAEITSPLDDDDEDDMVEEVSKPSTSDDDECATAPTCQLSRLETMSLRDIDFDPNDSPISLKPSRRASICSIDSRCNWLPWPEPQDDDANEDGLLESFGYRRRDSLDSIQNNAMARAA